jgi:hypothetical protein
MNNKIFFSFMLCVFSLVRASELPISPMYSYVRVNNENSGPCIVTWVERKSLEVPTLFDDLESKDTHRVRAQSIILAKDKKSVEIIGCESNNQYVINFAGTSFVNLKKELEKAANAFKGGFFPVFEIRLTGSNKPLVLVIGESQAQEQIMGKWSLESKIMAIFGVGFVAALIYYFDLHSKGMALLGRG